MQIAGEDRDRRFAFVGECEHLFDAEIRRTFLVGYLRLEFEGDVAPKAETAGLAGRPL